MFSDEDLKRLKEVITYANFPSVAACELKDLLARLEAAERYIELKSDGKHEESIGAYKAWWRSAGKDAR